METFHITEHTHVLTHPGGAVLFNSQTGHFHIHGTDSRGLLHIINETGSPQAIEDHLQSLLPTIPAPTHQLMVKEWIAEQQAAGTMAYGKAAARIFAEARPFSEEELLQAGDGAVVLTSLSHPPLNSDEQQIAYGSLLRSTDLIHLPFTEMAEAIRNTQAATERAATVEEARLSLAGLHQLSWQIPGRLACLEIALATVLSNAALGRRVELVLGAKLDPINFHAWPTAQGQPIYTEIDEPIDGQYYPLFQI